MTIVYGGSFNPITNAHLEVIDKLKNISNNNEIIIVPVGDDYDKEGLINQEYRINMVKLAVKNIDGVSVSRYELDNPYRGTIDTLGFLSKEYDDLHFVIGGDNLEGFCEWNDYEELLNKYKVVVVNRENTDLESIINSIYSKYRDRFVLIKDFNIEISSTLYRLTLDSTLIPNEVVNYIKDNNIVF